MTNRTILAQQIELASQELKPLAGGFVQCRWNPPVWEHGFYRVYLNGRLVAVTHQAWLNVAESELPSGGGTIKVFAEMCDIES